MHDAPFALSSQDNFATFASPLRPPAAAATHHVCRPPDHQRHVPETFAGERRCLACGKAFTEVGRLAQHLRDVHGGVNTPVNDSYPTQQRPGGRGSAPLTLGDVAVVRKSVVTAWQTPEPRRQQQRQGPAPERLQQALAPPPGTRARQRKQQSRLKRGFLRARAAAAVERWWTTLSELEGAMQATREAAAVLHNRTALLRAALESEHAAPAGHLAASAARVADMGVHLQLLDRQAVDAAENMAGLAAAHAHARERLAAAQEAALQFERLAVAEPATAPVPTSDPGDKNYYNGAEKKLEVCGEPPAAEQEAAACSTGPTLPMAVVTAAVHAQQPSPVPALHHEPPSDCAATEADSYSSLGWDNALSRWMPPALQTLDQQRKDAARVAPAVQPATAVIGPALPATAPPRSNSSSEQDVVAAGKEAAEGSSGGGDSGGSSEGSSLELGWTNTLAEWARGRRSEALTVMQAYATGGVLEAAAPDPPLPGNTVDLHGGQRRPSPFSTCAAAGVPTDKGAASDPPVSYAELSSRAVSSEGDEEISLHGDSPVKAHSIMHGSIDSGHRGSADGLSLLPFHAQASNRSAGFGSELSLRSLQHSSSDQQGQQPTGAGISVREWLSASEEAAAAAAAYIASSSKRSLHASLLVHPALGSGAQAPPASAQSRHAVAKAPAASLCQGLCASEAPPPADCGCAINENDSTPSQHASTPHTQAEDSASQPSAHTHDDRISVADWASEDGRQLPISPPAFVPITLGAVAAAAPVGAYLGGLPPGHSIATDGTVGLPFAPVAFFVRHGDRPESFVCCLCNVRNA